MNFFPWFVLWVLMAATVLVLAAWRKTVTRDEDDSLHVRDAEAAVPRQVAMANKIARIDKWGKGATIIAVVYGLTLLAIYMYQLWTSTSTTIQQ